MNVTEMTITAGGFTRTITITSQHEGEKIKGQRRAGLRIVEKGELFPVYRAYCDQLSLIYTEAETESVAIEKMRIAACEIYQSLAK